MDMPTANQPVLISDIEVMGVAYTSKCTQCQAGYYNDKSGVSECKECPENTYSAKGAIKCISCDPTTQYAGIYVKP